MRRSATHPVLLAAAAAFVLTTATAQASHFRGAAIVPEIDANGTLTATSETFWRPTAVNTPYISVFDSGGANLGFMTWDSTSDDTSDSRFTRRQSTQTFDLSNAGADLYELRWNSNDRVAGINNAAQDAWEMNSFIRWDGATASNPIDFSFSTVQTEVVRGANYSDNLNAISPDGHDLSYDQALNLNINSQPPGFNIDSTTGQLTIPASSTLTYTDNTSDATNGADYAFSGNIFATDSTTGQLQGSVEFDYVFDAVNGAGQTNLAPDVSDDVVTATVGDLINEIVTGTDNVDSVDDVVSLSLLSFLGDSSPNSPNFVAGTPDDPTTGTFTWDTTGAAPGVYVANIQGSDGQLTDIGGLTINLTAIPEPATLALLGLGGLCLLGRRRSGHRARD